MWDRLSQGVSYFRLPQQITAEHVASTRGFISQFWRLGVQRQGVADFVFGGVSFPGLQTATCLLHPHGSFLGVWRRRRKLSGLSCSLFL